MITVQQQLSNNIDGDDNNINNRIFEMDDKNNCSHQHYFTPY
jgi:hypothetical protein